MNLDGHLVQSLLITVQVYKYDAAFTSYFSSVLGCYGEIFWQSNFMVTGFMLAHSSSSSSPWQGGKGNSSVKQMLRMHAGS